MRIHSPSRHTPHCSLGWECTGETELGSISTTESIRCTPGKTRARMPSVSARGMPPILRLWKCGSPMQASLPSPRLAARLACGSTGRFSARTTLPLYGRHSTGVAGEIVPRDDVPRDEYLQQCADES